MVEDALTAEQRHRYARHVLLPEVGLAGQARLLAGSAQVVGMGRAAEEAATYLAAAGVGHLALEPALAERLVATIAALNPDVRVSSEAVGDVVEVVPQDPERRADGAQAALEALLVLTAIRPRCP